MESIELAWKIRRDVIEMAHLSHGSHVASALSVADIIAVLYADILKYDIKNINWNERDRVILSKGHAGSAIYAALAEVGFFDINILKTHYSNGSILSGHVSHKGVNGVEFSTGSLGHGLPVAIGMALSAKKNNLNHKVYAILGDGECDEGTTWECALIASSFKLDNLVVIIDHNKMQAMGNCEDIIKLEPFDEKWKSFGWNTLIVDGNNHCELKEGFNSTSNDKPTVIIANTIKGKGISFMENNIVWHYRDPQGEDYDKAVKELEELRK